MRRIIRSCFEKTDEAYYDFLRELEASHDLYSTKYKIKVLGDSEQEFIKFLNSSFERAKAMPSEDLFKNNFDNIDAIQDPDVFNVPELSLRDFRVYIYNFISKRVNKKIAREILDINQDIGTNGLTESKMSRIQDLYRISNIHKSKKFDINYDYYKSYQDKLSRPIGMLFNIKELDDKLYGLDLGSMTTIAGFTSHFKTTLALNLAYHNVYNNNYNVIYLSLETPKEDMYWNLLSRHSSNIKFGDRCIPHDRIRRCELSQSDIDFLFNEVDADFHSSKGNLIILDESDFDTLSFPEIYNAFEYIDDALGGELDAFVIDYIQLFKYSERTGQDNDNATINLYVSFFRRLTQNFRGRKLIGVVLSQINRESWKRAAKSGGRYDLTCLADANELERGSHRVITLFTSDSLKASHEARLQILKNRYGQTMFEPSPVYVDGERYLIGEELSGFGSPVSSFGGQSLGDAFDSLDLNDLDII